MDFIPTKEQINTLYKSPPYSACLHISLAELEKFASLFDVPLAFLRWMWNSREDKAAALRVVIRSPKGLCLYRAYFYACTEKELLFNNGFEAKHIYWLCKVFGLGIFPDAEVKNKEQAAKILVRHLDTVRNEKILT